MMRQFSYDTREVKTKLSWSPSFLANGIATDTQTDGISSDVTTTCIARRRNSHWKITDDPSRWLIINNGVGMKKDKFTIWRQDVVSCFGLRTMFSLRAETDDWLSPDLPFLLYSQHYSMHWRGWEERLHCARNLKIYFLAQTICAETNCNYSSFSYRIGITKGSGWGSGRAQRRCRMKLAFFIY